MVTADWLIDRWMKSKAGKSGILIGLEVKLFNKLGNNWTKIIHWAENYINNFRQIFSEITRIVTYFRFLIPTTGS